MVAAERKRRGTLYETVETRGSGTGEGLGSTGGREDGRMYEGSEGTARREKEKKGVNRCDTRRRSYAIPVVFVGYYLA